VLIDRHITPSTSSESRTDRLLRDHSWHPRENADPAARTEDKSVKTTQQLHDAGQSIWLDNITRTLLSSGGLQRYIDEFSVTGLTSNPTIFDHAIGNTDAYDDGILDKTKVGRRGEALFLELALEDLRRAADLFRPVHDATDGVDGWVSMEVSPLLANDTARSIDAASRIHGQAGRPNLFVKIPGTPEGVPAIEASVFAGVPINVTLLFSREQYVAAAEAYLRGIERRLAAGLSPRVASVASLFVSRWDKAVSDKVPADLRNRLGIAIAARTYRAYRELLASPRWLALAGAGARPQRLLWASTGTKDPSASDTLYVEALAAPDTINTIPEKTLHAFAAHGELKGTMAEDGGDAEAVLARFVRAGIDADAIARQLQRDGAQAFVKSWQALMQRLDDKGAVLAGAGRRAG
jgi:transaldolase